MSNLETMKTVYSYYSPEVDNVVSSMRNIDQAPLYLTQTPASVAQEILNNLGLPHIEAPATVDGKIDLDGLHEPIISQITKIYDEILPGLSEFKSVYPTAGSSEGIFHFLARLSGRGISEFYVLGGEYEGYAEYGKMLGLRQVEIPSINSFKNIKKGVVIISNPSAIDGNIISNEAINFIASQGHEIIYDASYVGSTTPHSFDLTNPAISTVFISFSKPYGLFRFRIGFTYSKEPIPSLYANKWFKHIGSLLLSCKVAREIGPLHLSQIYKPMQEEIVRNIQNQTNLPLLPSDAFLLAHIGERQSSILSPEQKKLIEIYKRKDGYRFCLTPYLEKFSSEK